MSSGLWLTSCGTSGSSGKARTKKENYKICFQRGRLENDYIIIIGGRSDESRSAAVEVKIKIHNSAGK